MRISFASRRPPVGSVGGAGGGQWEGIGRWRCKGGGYGDAARAGQEVAN